MGGEARLDAWVTFSGEAMRLLILFVAQQKPSDGGLWHPILMQFYSGPLMHLLSGLDSFRRSPVSIRSICTSAARRQKLAAISTCANANTNAERATSCRQGSFRALDFCGSQAGDL